MRGQVLRQHQPRCMCLSDKLHYISVSHIWVRFFVGKVNLKLRQHQPRCMCLSDKLHYISVSHIRVRFFVGKVNLKHKLKSDGIL